MTLNLPQKCLIPPIFRLFRAAVHVTQEAVFLVYLACVLTEWASRPSYTATSAIHNHLELLEERENHDNTLPAAVMIDQARPGRGVGDGCTL